MSVIDKLIFEIKQEIPRPVLEVAFLKRMGRNHKYAGGLDWEIRNKVIDARIHADLGIMGSETINVPLARSEVQFLENQDYRTVVRIPKTLTKGRPIAEVIAFNYYYNMVAADLNNGWQASSYNAQNCGNSPVMGAAQQILRSAAPAPVVSTANVELVGENVIVINDYMGKVQRGSMTVRLGQDPELSSWDGVAVFQLSIFTIEAVKAWIYANTFIDLDSGYLYGGAELGRIQNVIESYADANKNYQEMRVDMQMVNFTQDKARYQTFTRGLIGGQGR